MENNIFFKFMTDTLIPSYNEKEDGIITLEDLAMCAVALKKVVKITFTDKQDGTFVTDYYLYTNSRNKMFESISLLALSRKDIVPKEKIGEIVKFLKKSQNIQASTINTICNILEIDWKIELVF